MTEPVSAESVNSQTRWVSPRIADHLRGLAKDVAYTAGHAAVMRSAADEIDRLRATLARVEGLHTSDGSYCFTCDDEVMPCPTLRAIDGTS